MPLKENLTQGELKLYETLYSSFQKPYNRYSYIEKYYNIFAKIYNARVNGLSLKKTAKKFNMSKNSINHAVNCIIQWTKI